MGLDKLNLTIYEPPDTGKLEEVGYNPGKRQE